MGQRVFGVGCSVFGPTGLRPAAIVDNRPWSSIGTSAATGADRGGSGAEFSLSWGTAQQGGRRLIGRRAVARARLGSGGSVPTALVEALPVDPASRLTGSGNNLSA